MREIFAELSEHENPSADLHWGAYWQRECETKDLELKKLRAEIEATRKASKLTKADVKILGQMFAPGSKPSDEELDGVMRRHLKSALKATYGKKAKRFYTLKIMELATDSQLFGDDASEFATKKVARAYGRMVFEPLRILKHLDTHPTGTCSQNSIDDFAHLENYGPGTVAYKHGESLITPKSAITYAHAQLNRFILKTCKVYHNTDKKNQSMVITFT